MENIKAGRAAASLGFAASVWSKRAGEHCVSVDLVRVALRVKRKEAFRRACDRFEAGDDAFTWSLGPVSDWALDMDQASGLRERMAAAFGGYLVTDEEPVFSLRRGAHSGGGVRCMSGPQGGHGDRCLRDGFDDDSIDAPVWISGGGCQWFDTVALGGWVIQKIVSRPGRRS